MQCCYDKTKITTFFFLFLFRVEIRIKQTPSKPVNFRNMTLEEELATAHPDDLLAARFEEFGTTPPRTRMKNKSRDWERKQRQQAVTSIGGT